MRARTLIALLLGAASLFALGYAVADLTGGVRDIPRHWWSTLPVLGLVAAAVLGWWSRTETATAGRR